MSISLRDNRTVRICADALLTAVAMMLSYLEVLLPLNLLIPLPGFKLGLANLVTVLAFVTVSKVDSAVILTLRIVLMSLLFGTVTSFWFSALGGLLSYLILLLASVCFKKCSLLGVSVLCATAHNVGQCLAAATLFGFTVVLSYLPYLLFAAILAGGVTGVLLNLTVPSLRRAIK